MIFAHIIKALKLPHSKHQSTESYLYYRKCGYWGKKILDKVAKKAIENNWLFLEVVSFKGNRLIGFIHKYFLDGYVLYLTEIYNNDIMNCQFVISLHKR